MLKICIDPGHGGRDPGAVGQGGLQEKDVNLAVAKKVAKHLESMGYEAILTRSQDEYVSLEARSKLANLHRVSVFVSIHCNSAENRAAQGTETFCYPTSSEGKTLAEMVQRELISRAGGKDRGVKHANFQVLRETAMPAILVELAFISNENEEHKLSNSSFQDSCALAISEGVDKYLVQRFKGRVL